MDIHEAQEIFGAITSDFVMVGMNRYVPTKLHWWKEAERLSLLQEFLQGLKWRDGYYLYSSDCWLICKNDHDRRCGSKYITKNGQVLFQDRYLPVGGNIDDVQISHLLIDEYCTSVELLVDVSRELLTYAKVFGLDPEKIESWSRRLSVDAPAPLLYVVR